MRMLGTIAVGMIALLGSSALADLPLVKQASAIFNTVQRPLFVTC
ncbi:hypothetical protein D187_009985 [Cystobacter fuscus DSM 2262]|uniref:Uncharacterized protein n=1 Tax=Cystobacter fuscus (strain ATCC 25194 / DSM 2262 / NBRC 100088 / M29) TaxID=1242864 RepID=S9PGA6_CYSF2|nr:hypothetical protein [Cystobacter fuscus]EPX62081.1 hypothetical protein D187_009985 [Cystobacter fuscus DSM 2262]